MSFIQILLVACMYHLTNTFASTGGMVFGRYTCQRPLVGGLLVGLLLGDVQKGLELGIAFQLAYMGAFAVGGAVTVDVGVVSYPIMALAISSGLDTGTALALAAPVSVLTANLTHVMRAFNTVCTGIVRKAIEEVDYRKMFLGNVVLPQLFLAGMNFTVVFALLPCGCSPKRTPCLEPAWRDSSCSRNGNATEIQCEQQLDVHLLCIGLHDVLRYEDELHSHRDCVGGHCISVLPN